jgi:hypothetical protein
MNEWSPRAGHALSTSWSCHDCLGRVPFYLCKPAVLLVRRVVSYRESVYCSSLSMGMPHCHGVPVPARLSEGGLSVLLACGTDAGGSSVS